MLEKIKRNYPEGQKRWDDAHAETKPDINSGEDTIDDEAFEYYPKLQDLSEKFGKKRRELSEIIENGKYTSWSKLEADLESGEAEKYAPTEQQQAEQLYNMKFK
jgi:hypothetical protein